METRVCANCGHQMRPRTRSHALYCSTRCRVAAHRKNTIPRQMRTHNRWINHDSAKRPINPRTGRLASSTNPDTWSSYTQARSTRRPLGYVLGDGIGCIDLDHCIHADGTLTPAAQTIVNFYPHNWIEISPSGHGLHIWGTATPQPGFKREWRGQMIEFYSRGRYITITGRTYQHGTLEKL